MNFFKKRYGVFKEKWKDAIWFRVLSFVSFYSYSALLLVLIGVCNLLAFYFGESGSNKKFNGITSQKNKNADDIWDQTSGNDYYKNEPPDKLN